MVGTEIQHFTIGLNRSKLIPTTCFAISASLNNIGTQKGQLVGDLFLLSLSIRKLRLMKNLDEHSAQIPHNIKPELINSADV